jgi:hypothetical protein
LIYIGKGSIRTGFDPGRGRGLEKYAKLNVVEEY